MSVFFFQTEDGHVSSPESRWVGDVYEGQGLGAHAPRAGGALASSPARANGHAAYCAPHWKANVAAALARGGQFHRRAASLGRILQASAAAAHSGGYCAAHARGLYPVSYYPPTPTTKRTVYYDVTGRRI